MFEGFERQQIETSGATINVVRGGSGPPLLLLHGYPQSHAMWHRVAPELARDFTVVATDLRGYGDSSKPECGDDHAGYSKRAMSQDQVEVMATLGFDAFAVAGHDRGARVAYRMAIDQPARVTRLAVLDVIPTHSVYNMMNRGLATAYYHWFFLVQPFDLPERLIGADPVYYLRDCLARWSGRGLDCYDAEALAEYERCFRDPATIHATCEDYRAGATVDFETDAADAGKRPITCPTLALYSKRFEALRPLEVWQEWAKDVTGRAIECGHFIPEEAPEETLAALREFLG